MDDDTSQYVVDFPTQYLVQAGLETAAFAAIVVVALTVLHRWRAAGLVALGALMACLGSLSFFAEYAEPRVLGSHHVFEFLVLDHPHLDDALAWMRVVGVAVMAAAVVLLLRSPGPGRVPENAV